MSAAVLSEDRSPLARHTARRRAALAALVLLIGAGMALLLRPARADQGNTISYTVGGPTVSRDESSAVAPDPESHALLRTNPGLCSLEPTCRLFVVDLSYLPKNSPDTQWFTTVTATLHGTAVYQLALFADPEGNSAEVSNDTGTGRTLVGRLVTTSDDPIQEYGITMYLTNGANTPFTLTITSSTVAFPTPFESLNPLLTPPSIPPPLDTTPPTTAPPVTSAPPPTTVAPAAPLTPPPPAQTAPDSSFSGVFADGGGFNAALAPPGAQLFKKAAAVKPPGKPSRIELWLGLLALPFGILLVFPVLIRRYRQVGV